MAIVRSSKALNLKKVISEQRGAIMGVSILWVLFYHFGLNIPVLRECCQNGFIGVDLFLFLSGFGLYRSLDKGKSVSGFYFRRVCRIFPCYLIFGIAMSFIVFGDSFPQFLLKVSTVGYWIGGDSLSYEWYVPSLLALYLAFPLLYVLLQKSRKGWILLLCAALCASVVLAFNKNISCFPYYLLIYRIPIFILGTAVAAGRIGNTGMIIIAISGLVLTVAAILCDFEPLDQFYLGRSFVAPFLILVLAQLFSRLKWLSVPFSFIGSVSFETYLVHYIPLKYNNGTLWYSITMATLSIIVGYGLHYLSSRMLQPNKRAISGNEA